MDIGCVILESFVEQGVYEVDDRSIVSACTGVDDKLVDVYSGGIRIGILSCELSFDACILVIDRTLEYMFLRYEDPYRHTDGLSDILYCIEIERVVNGQDDFAVFLTYREHYILLGHLSRNELNCLRINGIRIEVDKSYSKPVGKCRKHLFFRNITKLNENLTDSLSA